VEEAWWHSQWRLAVGAVALLFLGASFGYFVWGGDSGPSRPNAQSVDVGFLQDMSVHHDQAVKMAFIILDKPTETINATIRSIAYEIARGQQNEMGRMYQLLADWNRPTDSDSDTVMAWMGEPTPVERMPGLATDENLTQLRGAQGHDADLLFARLMIAHHQGGLHMASYAAEHGKTSQVRQLASGMVADQEGEVRELTKLMGLPAS
jgi:uncharacterized protein (DUF305 family)